jgi:hypothetical protein
MSAPACKRSLPATPNSLALGRRGRLTISWPTVSQKAVPRSAPHTIFLCLSLFLPPKFSHTNLPPKLNSHTKSACTHSTAKSYYTSHSPISTLTVSTSTSAAHHCKTNVTFTPDCNLCFRHETSVSSLLSPVYCSASCRLLATNAMVAWRRQQYDSPLRSFCLYINMRYARKRTAHQQRVATEQRSSQMSISLHDMSYFELQSRFATRRGAQSRLRQLGTVALVS